MNDGIPFYRRPKPQILIAVLLIAIIYGILAAVSGGWSANILAIFLQSSLCGIFFIVWFIFFSQFILPVQKFSDRIKLLERIILYYLVDVPLLGFTHLKGPAVFIKDGKVIQKVITTGGEIKQEIQAKGPGVIWLDSASAAVLRTPVKFTRSVGPGIVFTDFMETIAGVVDLRTQIQTLGPGSDEDPFAAKTKTISEEEYKETQQRIRWSTSGLTRDGIEVVPGFSVIFKIDADEKTGEGGTHFGFNADAVFKAVANEVINPNAKQNSPNFSIPWNEIPAAIAVDVWRDYLRKFTLSQLFETLPPSQAKSNERRTALQFIGDMIDARMKNGEVEDLDDFGRPTGKKVASREYRLIKDYGIKIIKTNIRKVYFSPAVEDQLVHEWTAGWLEMAMLERERVEQKRNLASQAGGERAQKQIALLACQEILLNPPETPKEALEALVQDALNGILHSPSLSRRLSTEYQDLTEMVQWLRENT